MNYINSESSSCINTNIFDELLKEYIKNIEFTAQNNNIEIPNYVIFGIIKICQGITEHYNFKNYSFITEMMNDVLKNYLSLLRDSRNSKKIPETFSQTFRKLYLMSVSNLQKRINK
jgi:hypothetical protein